MDIWAKLTVLLCIYIVVPLIIAALYKKIDKHDFSTGFLYSLVSMLIMPIAMEGLGSKEFSTFLLTKTDGYENVVLSIFRLVAFAVIFCLGGSSFISRVYKIVTGQEWPELDKLESKFSEKIEEVKAQSEKIAVAVVSGEIGNTASNKDDIRSLIELVNQNNGLLISSIPDNKKELLHEMLTIGAAQSVIDDATFETKIVLSEFGKSMLNNKLTH